MRPPDPAGLATGGPPEDPLRARQRLRRVAVMALAFLALFLIPLPDNLQRLGWLDIPGDLMHVPLLGGFAWFAQRRGPLAGRPLAAAAAAVGAGLAIELIQTTTGRQASLVDLSLDTAGAGLVGCWLRWRRGGTRAWLVVGLAMLTPAVLHASALPGLLAADRLAARRFPLLADFETGVELTNWLSSHEARLRVVPRDGGGCALAIDGLPPQSYPGAILRGFPRDWTAWPRLEWDARVVGVDSLRFIVRLDDFAARDDGAWTARRYIARTQWRHYSWTPGMAPDRRSSRPQRRDDMDAVIFYLSRFAVPATLEIDNLRLR